MTTLIKNKTRILFVGIIILAFVLRFFLLGSNPPSLDWDEASIGYNAYSILHTAKDEYGNFLPLSFRSFDDFKPPVYVYLTVPSIALFGLNEYAVRFPAALIGVFAVIVVYYFTKELLTSWDKKRSAPIALCATFFLAVSPWHLQFSRAAFEGNVGLFFLILSLLLFFKAFKKPFCFLLFALCFVLSMYSYHSFRLINPIILVALVALFHKDLLKQKVIAIASTVLIFILAAPIYLSFVNPQGTGARLSMVTIFSDPQIRKISAEKTLIAKQNNDLVGQIIYNRRFIFIPNIIKGYFDHFKFDFLFLKGDSGVQHHAYNMGMLYLWDFPFILIGLFFILKKLDKKTILILIIFLIAPLPAAITSGTPHPVRAIAMIPFFQIFEAVGFVMAASLLYKRKNVGVFVIGVIIVLFLSNIGYYLYSYYVLTPVKYGYFWQYGNKQAVLYAKSVEARYNKIIMSYEYDQPYIYYLFYNKIDPSWYQRNWNYTGSGEIYRFYRKIGKYEFRIIDYEKDKLLKNTLLVGTPKEIKEGNIIKDIKYLDGSKAYRIVAN